jgi:hypothetical protein
MPEMNNDGMEELVRGLREEYNPPPETPREEMWASIEARIGAPDEKVVSLEAVRRSRVRKPLAWAGAAAALVILGLGIGRMTAPGVDRPGTPGAEVIAGTEARTTALRVAALDHLAQTESLLTLVRADARSGRVDPSMGSWAKGLLSQTRLLMDVQGDSDPVMKELLQDLELVLVQIVGVANATRENGDRVRSELNLALSGLEEREVLPRIQAVVPAGPRFAGT